MQMLHAFCFFSLNLNPAAKNQRQMILPNGPVFKSHHPRQSMACVYTYPKVRM